ncbi:MAG: lactate/malate dehydrogenase family protein [Armatimonadetes bacterium]|nr:lactate/malate dehydrogenase family protein [Armatimonadota bacterium]
MKVSIIGGGGRVGSDAAFCLQLGGLVREIVLVDMNQDMAAGEALDLRHGSALTASQTITSGDYDAVKGSDCVVITAGLRRKPDETRLQLISRNVDLFKGILDSLKGASLPKSATILVVSNPVDILTQLTVESGILPASQILGLGTVLDTCRFRSLLAEEFGVGARDMHALILGEHGDSMVPIWSSATVNGIALSSLPGYTKEKADAVFDFTKKSGAEVIRMKGGAGRAVGVSIAEVVHAMALNSGAILPVSSMQEGALGISGVCLSLPTRVGRAGVLGVIEPDVTEAEKEGLHKSAASLKDVRGQIN